jgi:hypothetical protein
MGLVSRGVKVVIQASNWMTFETNMPLPQAQIRKRLSSIVHPNAIQFTPDDGEYLTIGLPNGMRESKAALQELKSILADSSLFPICRVEDIGTTDWSKWDKCGVADKKVALLGRKLTTVSGQREGF